MRLPVLALLLALPSVLELPEPCDEAAGFPVGPRSQQPGPQRAVQRAEVAAPADGESAASSLQTKTQEALAQVPPLLLG